MNKTELRDAVALKADVSKAKASEFIDGLIEIITEQLKKDKTVEITGFGKFAVAERSARKGRNPQTGEEITIAAKKAPKFKPGKQLKDAVA